MAKLGSLVVRIGADTRDLNAKLGTVQKQMRTMTGNFKKLGRSMSKSITLPLLAVGAAALKVGVDFEAAMSKVKAVSGATGADFSMLEQSAKKLGATTTFTASQVASLQLEFAKLGYSATQIEAVTESTLYLAQATGSDLAQAAEVAGATLGGFGLGASEVTRVTDIMAASFTGSALDINKFQDSMKFVAPVAKAAGVSIEEATAILGTLANAGIKGSQAGTALRRVLQEMSGEGGTLTEKLAKLSAKGLGVKDAFDEVGRNASSALLVMTNGVDDITAFTKELENSGGSAKTMADIMNDNAAGALKKMTSALEGLGISIGTMLMPIFEGLVNTVTSLAAWFNDLSGAWKKIITIVATFLAALGPLLILLPKLIALFGFMRTAILGMNLAMLANPFILAAVAIAAVTAAVIGYNLASATAIKQTRNYRKELSLLSLEDQKRKVEQALLIFKDPTGPLAHTLAKIDELEDEWRAKRFVKIGEAGGWETRQQKEQAKRKLEALKSNNSTFIKEVEMLETELDRINKSISRANQKILDDEAAAAAAAAGAPGSLDELRATVARLTKELNGLDMKSEEFTTTQGLLKIATDELNKALDSMNPELEKAFLILDRFGNKIEGDFMGQVFKIENTGELLGFLNDFGEAANKIADISETIEFKFQGVATAMGTMFGEMVSGAQTGAEAFKTFAKSAISSVIAMAKANVIAAATNPLSPWNIAGGGLLAPAFALAGLSALDALLSNIPALAGGGLAFGPTLAMVGDNRNASADPEVIAPLSKLKELMGVTAVQVYGRISGDDIVISNSRASRDRNRF